MWRRCSTSGWSCMAIRSSTIAPPQPRMASGGRPGVKRYRGHTVMKSGSPSKRTERPTYLPTTLSPVPVARAQDDTGVVARVARTGAGETLTRLLLRLVPVPNRDSFCVSDCLGRKKLWGMR